MRKTLMVLCALMLFSSVANAIPSDSTNVALFADTLRTGWRVDKGAGVTPFELWIWWFPSYRGLRAAEFRLIFPSSIIQGTLTPNNDALSISSGTAANGVMCAWLFCQYDWTWSHTMSLFLKDALPAQITVSSSNVSGKLQIGWCPPQGVPLEPVRRWNNFCLNYDCGVGVESKSWGAIKELYR